MKIGIFGGTFDPPHIGHLIVAQDAAEVLALDQVLFVPAAQPPHKRDRAITAATQRLAMLELAIAGADVCAISTLELDRPGLSWTVDTLRQLRQSAPGDELVLLIGMDQYRELHTWREPAEVRRLAMIAALTREGEADTAAFATMLRTVGAPGDVCVPVTRIDISSTALRQRVAAGRPIRHLVPRAVESFIAENRLYTETALR